jgi:hypothetical protein
LNHTLRPRPKQYAPRWPKQGGIPDFALATISVETARINDLRLFGESKPLNEHHRAHEEVEEYLQSDHD